jgi:predicted transcriptional regulator
MPYTPDRIGWKRTDTSRLAALGMTPRASTIRAEVLSCLARSPVPLTSEEVSDAINKPECSVRPRLTELRNMLMVQDSGTRKIGKYGKPIIAWETKPNA